jgi:hypothetical protein
MKTYRSDNRPTYPITTRTHYRVVNHDDAGPFESMTGATLWALKNLDNLHWRIEPFARVVGR